MIPGNANPLLLATAADGAAAAGVATRSLRFNDDDSSSLSRTISSSGNLKAYTLSMWVKRSKLGYLYSMLYSTNGTNGIYYSFKNTDKLEFADYYGGSYQFQLVTSRVFRDTSAWYHIVVAVDTTQATASDRIKIYINGVQETTFDTSNYPAQNYEGSVNRASIVEYLGDMPAGDGFNGYIADVHLVDGSQLDHTSFGAFDDNGVWQAAAYSGTFGTNGFHLDFSDSTSATTLAEDSSGNDNDWTPNNITIVNSNGDYLLDLAATYDPPLRCFDGDTSTRARAANAGDPLVFTPTGGIAYTSSIEVWDWLPAGSTYWKVNGGTAVYSPNSGNQWVTVATGSGTLTNLTSYTSGRGGFAAIRIDGTILIDKRAKRDDDSQLDAPTNGSQSDTGAGGEVSGNYCTWNPLQNSSLVNGNLDTDGTGNFYGTIQLPSSGKWYWEVTAASVSYIGIDTRGQGGTNYIHYNPDGQKQTASGTSSYGASFTTEDIIGVAVNMDDEQITWYKNNTSQGTVDFSVASLSNTDPLQPQIYQYSSKTSSTNWGQRAFVHTAPSGYKALCTTNLPTPAIADPSTAFDVALWTGNGSARSISTNNSPDFVWMKARTLGSANHGLFDTIRGATKRLISHSTAKESTQSQTLTAFNSDGFDLGTDSAYNGNTYPVVGWAWSAGENSNKTYTVKVVSDSGNKYRFDDFGTSAVTLDLEEGSTYVFDQSDSSNSGHPLRFSTTSDGTHNSGSEYTTGVTTTGTPGSAGAKTTIVVAASAPTLYYYCSAHSGMGGQANTNSTAGASNFDGTIQTTVKASQTAGFSIVGWNASSQSAAYVGHGLGKQPELIFSKTYDGTGNWYVFEPSLDTGGTISKALYLHDDTGKVTVSGIWGHWDEMTSTTFGITDSSGSGTNDGDMIAYCFTSANGFSSFGTYTGNGNTDGPFVALSFRPAFLLLKNTGSSGNWLIYDNKREGYNFNNDPLYAHLASAEGTTDYLDLLSNGFKIRNTHSSINASSNTYLYAAFALHPLSANGGLAR